MTTLATNAIGSLRNGGGNPHARGLPAEVTSHDQPHAYSLIPVGIFCVFWVAAIAVNYVTGRAMRFELSMGIWGLLCVLMICSGKGMYQMFLLALLPAILIGATDFFELFILTVEMSFFVPFVLLLGYYLTGALRRYYPERNRLTRKSPLIPQTFLFVLACTISAFSANVLQPTQALRAIGVTFIVPFFYYLYTVHAIRRLPNVKQIATVIVFVTAFYSASLGILQLFHRSMFALVLRNLVIVPQEKIDQMWKMTYGEGKIMSVWPDAASFGHALCFSLPLALGLAIVAKSNLVKFSTYVALGFIAFGVLITGNRTDIVGAMATFAILAFAYWRKSPKVRSIFLKAAVLGMVVIGVVISTRDSNGLTRLLMPQDWDKKTASSRTILIGEGMRMFDSSPMFGVGLDNFRLNQDYRKDGFYIVGEYAHNFFVQILAETGIVGFVTYMLLMGSVFILAPVTWRNRTRSEFDMFCFLYLVSCLVLILQGLVENALFYNQTASLFWTSVGIWRGRAMEIRAVERAGG